jgi:hypothetical protein
MDCHGSGNTGAVKIVSSRIGGVDTGVISATSPEILEM